MGVYKYTKAMQNASGLKTKSEPWLHAAIDVSQEGVSIAVFVWDTREVLETRFTPFKNYGEYRQFADDFYRRRYAKANDNGVKLNWGSHKPLSRINDELFRDSAKAATESVVVVGRLQMPDGTIRVEASEFDSDIDDPRLAWHEEMRRRFPQAKSLGTKAFDESDFDSEDDWLDAIDNAKKAAKATESQASAKAPTKRLYIHDELDKLTIDFGKIEKPMQSFGTVKLSYDPHGGWYFAGKAEYMKALQNAIKERTDIVD